MELALDVIPNHFRAPLPNSRMNESLGRSFAGTERPVLDAPILKLIDIDLFNKPVNGTDAGGAVQMF